MRKALALRKAALELFDNPSRLCPLCGEWAVCKLPPNLAAQQTDGTTHVCHPSHGGCNHGFEVMPTAPAVVV